MDNFCKQSPVIVNPIFKHPDERRLSLAGVWKFFLDPEDTGISDKLYENVYKMFDEITVPGCWQGQGFGKPENDYVRDFRYHTQVFKATYKGTAWYGKIFRIPSEWKGLRIWLNFGGVSPTSDVWVNGIKVGSNNLPFTPFGFDITDIICIENDNTLAVRVSEEDRELALCYNWAGNWSGIYGSVELTAFKDIGFGDFRLYPEADEDKLKIKAKFLNADKTGDTPEIRVKVSDAESEIIKASETFPINNDFFDGEFFEFSLNVPERKSWSPDNPDLYRIDAELVMGGCICDATSVRTGFVKLTTKGKHIKINGEPYYMRGTGDFCETPETGCPDTDRDRWRRKLKVLRAYGYNYVRCQSYVPIPEYLDAADEVGLIVQSEMGILGPLGGHSDFHVYQWPQPTPDIYRYIRSQWNITVLRDVNHPSASFYCMSNELSGNLNRTEYPKIAWKAYRDTKRIKPDSMVIWTDGGYNKDLPGDFINDQAVMDSQTDKPVIQHEYAWWSSFPDIRIKSKFTGAMIPYGINIAYKNAQKHGLSHLMTDAAKVSQRLQYLEAKTKMERCRRDYPLLAGICHFNAMDINASPQGIVDIFYEKKYADSRMWLQTNGDTIILSSLGFDDRIVKPGDTFLCKLHVSDFSHPALEKPSLNWRIISDGDILAEGLVKYQHKSYCTCFAGEVKFTVPDIKKPLSVHLEAELKEDGRCFKNSWSLWIIPDKYMIFDSVHLWTNGIVDWLNTLNGIIPECHPDNFRKSRLVVTDRITPELVDYIKKGGNVFFAAGEGLIRAFQYKWSFRDGARYFYSNAACYPTYEDGQHGTVISRHPIFGDFPHEDHADLQFFRLISESPAIDLEPLALNDADPIMRMIHNYQVGRSLGQLLERKLGKGRIVLCSLNLNQSLPEARYLLGQFFKYILSGNFSEANVISEEAIENIMFAGTVVE